MAISTDNVVKNIPCIKPNQGLAPQKEIIKGNIPIILNNGIINKSPATYAIIGFCPDITKNFVPR